MPQKNHSSAADNFQSSKSHSTPSTRIFDKIQPAHLKLPNDDSRKLKHICRQRRTLLVELIRYSDRDGTSITCSVQTLQRALGWSNGQIYQRLDDLKKIGLLVDQERLGYNQPMRRRIDLHRAQELLGMPNSERLPRPASLPVCISNALWKRFIDDVFFYTDDDGIRKPEYPDQDDAETEVSFIVRGLCHYLREGRPESYIVQLIEHCCAIQDLGKDLQYWDDYSCGDETCPECFPPDKLWVLKRKYETMTEREKRVTGQELEEVRATKRELWISIEKKLGTPEALQRYRKYMELTVRDSVVTSMIRGTDLHDSQPVPSTIQLDDLHDSQN